jgi:hypothetical protein
MLLHMTMAQRFERRGWGVGGAIVVHMSIVGPGICPTTCYRKFLMMHASVSVSVGRPLRPPGQLPRAGDEPYPGVCEAAGGSAQARSAVQQESVRTAVRRDGWVGQREVQTVRESNTLIPSPPHHFFPLPNCGEGKHPPHGLCPASPRLPSSHSSFPPSTPHRHPTPTPVFDPAGMWDS